MIFVTVLEAGSPSQQWVWCLVNAVFLVPRWCSYHCIFTWSKSGRVFSGVQSNVGSQTSLILNNSVLNQVVHGKNA